MCETVREKLSEDVLTRSYEIFDEAEKLEYSILLPEAPSTTNLYVVEEIARTKEKMYAVVLSSSKPANYIPLPLKLDGKRVWFKPLLLCDTASSTSLGFYPVSLVDELLCEFSEKLGSQDLSWLGDEPYFLGLWEYARKVIKNPLDDTEKWITLSELGFLKKRPKRGFRYDVEGRIISGRLSNRIAVKRYLIFVDGKPLLYRISDYRKYIGVSEDEWREIVESYAKLLPPEHIGKKYYFFADVFDFPHIFCEENSEVEFYLLASPSGSDYVFDFGEVNAVAEASGWWITPKYVSASRFLEKIDLFYPYTKLELVASRSLVLKLQGKPATVEHIASKLVCCQLGFSSAVWY